METFPDLTRDYNTSLANQVITNISLVRKYPESDVYTTRLAQALKEYVTNIKIGTISTTITATPEG